MTERCLTMGTARLEFINGMEGFHVGIFRVEKVKDYTTISNYHLRDKNLSLKAKGLLTLILALPEDWNFTIRGLSAICKEGAESIGTALKELEKGGYLVRKRVRGIDGRMSDTEYNFYEEPVRQMEEPSEGSDDGQSGTEEPESEISEEEQPHTEKPDCFAVRQYKKFKLAAGVVCSKYPLNHEIFS